MLCSPAVKADTVIKADNFTDTGQETKNSQIVIENRKEGAHPFGVVLGIRLPGFEVLLPGNKVLAVCFKANAKAQQQSGQENSQIPDFCGRRLLQFYPLGNYSCRRLVPLWLKPG